jgi:hypothetical protein
MLYMGVTVFSGFVIPFVVAIRRGDGLPATRGNIGFGVVAASARS